MNGVIVIGGGIVGCYAAYFLARQGRTVTLIEKGEIGGKASGINPGGLNPLHGPGLPGVMSPLAERAFELNVGNWEKIRTLSGIDFHPHRVARVELAFDESEKAALLATLPHYETIPGFSARWMDREKLLKADPRLNPEIAGGLWTEGNGMVSSREYTRAVAAAAAALGATLLHAEVTGLTTAGDRVTGVVTDTRTLHAEAVLIANGPWASAARRWLGVEIPVTPLKGELLLTELPGAATGHHVTWKTIGIYQTPAGPSWLGGTQTQAGFDESATEEGRHSIIEAVARMVPEARRARIVRHLAGLRPVTPDGLPVIGLVPGWKNAYLATGSGPKGMLLGAGMGEAAAALISGNPIPFAPEPYEPGRFNNPSTI